MPPVLPSLETTPLALIVDLVRSDRATTRKDLVDVTGLTRKAVTQRVEQALELGLLELGDLAPSDGGRQARRLRFRARSGHVYSALIGSGEITAAVLDLDGAIVGTEHRDWSTGTGPEPTMKQLDGMFEQLARRTGHAEPWAIGVGVPGPVEFATGRLTAAPALPGWDGFSVRSWLRDHYDAPVWVDNDANLMAFGEWSRGTPRDGRDLLFLRVGTGIGAGLIVRGRVLRGQRGAAGDIAHLHVTDDPGARCRCGRTGCLEAVAGGWALLRKATELAAESPLLSEVLREHGEILSGDLGKAVVAGDPLALRLVDEASVALAEAVANLVTFCDPGAVVVGGGVLRTGQRFLDRLAETVGQRCDELTIRAASLGHLEGVIGAGLLAAENLLAQPALTRWVDRGTPLGQAVLLQRFSADLA
jgi:predicted NBD/HSP70 family sugar kinase